MDSQKTHAAAELHKTLSYCMGLSATPIYNYGAEVFNVLSAIAPAAVGRLDEFYREWCDGHSEKACLKDPDAFGAYLREHHWMVRRTRKEVGRELPPTQTMVETIDYDPTALEKIDVEATELAHLVLKGAFQESGEAARLLDIKLRQATGIAKAPFVAAFVQMLVAAEGESVLLAGWHREVYEVWEHYLRMAKIPVCYYTGTESPSQKEQSKMDFITGEKKVMFISLRSGAGLDGLQQVCKTVVFGELDWSPGVHEQVRGRLFRDGQKSNVAEIFLVANGGSDPIISDMLGLKNAQVKGLLEPGTGGLAKLQTDAGRIKRLAEQFLASHARKVEVEN
jgi:SNF2 family DNA or RNA helicase